MHVGASEQVTLLFQLTREQTSPLRVNKGGVSILGNYWTKGARQYCTEYSTAKHPTETQHGLPM